MNIQMIKTPPSMPPSFWQRRAVDVVLLAVILNCLWLWRNGYGNLYYAATVKSMLTSWHTFFFVSFDPAGFVTVDKPPLGFWLQAASAKLFGFHPLALLLPQAIAGTLSVALLYRLVCQAYGALAGVLAALILAITPISVATNRNNTMDSLLVLVVLLAAQAISDAAETGRLRSLLLCATFVGIGCNIKGLQAYLVLPAFVSLYLLAAPLQRRKRCAHLALAAVVLFGVSLSWAAAVDLTPSSQRPFVGSSSDNTEIDLMLRYNGLSRLFPQSDLSVLGSGQIGFGMGPAGPLRLLDRQLGGQIGWLLLPVALCLVVGGYRTYSLPRSFDRRHRCLMLWGTWFMTQGVIFSVGNFLHPYYLVILAPAIAALGGMGITLLWDAYVQASRQGWLLPLVIAGTAAVQVCLLANLPLWGWLLAPVVASLCTIAAGMLVGARLTTKLRGYAGVAVTLGFGALLVAPLAWAAIPVWHHGNNDLPIAGPDLLRSPDAFDQLDPASGIIPSLARYLADNRRGERYLVATPYAGVAAPLMLRAGQPVMAYGGYLGRDHIVTTARLTKLIAGRTVRFFLLVPNYFGTSLRPRDQEGIENWIKVHCTPVPASLWQPTRTSSPNEPVLYDCAHLRLQ